MKLEKKVINKTLAIAMSLAFAFLTGINAAAQEQTDPFKKEQADKNEKAIQPQLSELTKLVSVEIRMIEMPKLIADELFKEQGGIANTFVINKKTLDAINDMIATNKVKIVGQTKIITRSGMPNSAVVSRKMTVSTGPDQRPVSTSSNKAPVSANYQYVDIGTSLRITPIVINPSAPLINCGIEFRLTRSPLINESISSCFISRSGDTVLLWEYAMDKDYSQETPIILMLATACIVKAQ
jgi:hypothetical protein